MSDKNTVNINIYNTNNNDSDDSDDDAIKAPTKKLINRFIDKNKKYEGITILKKAFDFNEYMDTSDNIWTASIKAVDMLLLHL